MSTRTRLVAEYLYPGAFFPESCFKDVSSTDFEALVAAGPDDEGYFKKDRWYAVNVKAIVETRYVNPDNGAERWVNEGGRSETVASYIVGTLHHVDSIPDVDPETGRKQDILKSNIRGNSRDPLKGYGVLTRAGNWQIASDYMEVREP